MAAEIIERRTSDVVAGAVLAAFGALFTVVALQTPPDPKSSSVIGPSVFPTILGILLVAGGVALVLTGMRLRPTEREDPDVPQVDGKRLWVAIAMLTAYVLVFIPLGYVLSTVVFLMGLTTYFAPAKWKSNLAFAVLFPLVVLALFEYALRVPLPDGVLAGVLP